MNGFKWGFTKAGVPPNHPKLGHTSIETYGDLEIPKFMKPPSGC